MISKTLNVSTGNMAEDDKNYLEKENSFSVGNFYYGFFIHIASFSNKGFAARNKYSKAFHNVVALAKKLDCDYICFDRDADLIPGLPVFNW